MSDSRIIQISEALDARVEPHKLPGGRPGVRLVLPIKTDTGVTEIELVLSPELAVRYGTALVEQGSELGGE